MTVLLIGSEGSMGKRYQAIMRYLRIPFDCCDSKLGKEIEEFDLKQYAKIVVATPTLTHFGILSSIKDCDRPILCEKPVHVLREMLLEILSWPMDLSMMYQYQCMPIRIKGYKRVTSYDYFRTGSDGLYWDCLQPISLHDGTLDRLSINNTSPIWKCRLNGYILSIADMDQAYIYAFKRWYEGNRNSGVLSGPSILEAHDRVIQFKEYYESRNRDTSALNLDEIPTQKL